MPAEPQLITIDDVKAEFERWELFCTLDGFDPDTNPAEGQPGHVEPPESVLTRKIVSAETELLEYVTVTGGEDGTITTQLKRHLVNIAKKHCFDVQHGDTPFEHRPQIVKDYDAAIAMLERYRDGEFSVSEPEGEGPHDVKITAKERRFDTWFNSTDTPDF